MASSVSVVIPSYDEPREFLRECLESVLAQTRADWEAIVVDDAAATGYAHQVVADLADRRVRVIRHDTNRGMAASRNTGIRATAAPHIALLDADDRLHPEFLETALRSLGEEPGAGWVVVDWEVFGTRDEVWPVPADAVMDCPVHMFYVGAGAVLRRTVWERIGGYAEDPMLSGGAADWDFWIGAVERGFRPRVVPRSLYQYRRHAAQFSRARRPYYESQARRLIYIRHRASFESMGLGCPKCASPKQRVSAFLAQGYLVSSYASLERRERLRALRLAVAGLLERPRDRALAQQVGRVLVPWRVRRALERGSSQRRGSSAP